MPAFGNGSRTSLQKGTARTKHTGHNLYKLLGRYPGHYGHGPYNCCLVSGVHEAEHMEWAEVPSGEWQVLTAHLPLTTTTYHSPDPQLNTGYGSRTVAGTCWRRGADARRHPG